MLNTLPHPTHTLPHLRQGAPFFSRVAISICFSFSISKFISLRCVVLEILALTCKGASSGGKKGPSCVSGGGYGGSVSGRPTKAAPAISHNQTNQQQTETSRANVISPPACS